MPRRSDAIAHQLRSGSGESSAAVAERVHRVRELTLTRGVDANAALTVKELDEVAPLSPDAAGLLEAALRAGALSARGLRRIRTVALTLQDLDGVPPPILDRSIRLAMNLRVEPRFLSRRMAG